ncbi:MAG TPA: M23 family metallopeptidase [Candidatus Dorea gallistercoris]|uniref:M23 family metallopeptidase n=1 Tax=Candidatus Dorea gallistercoris TaxID=2838542 RepID=A0A9D1RB46_9FIRM|nr:M23 family metallopeptidase [Candidatus Dorea gallistercoris]
MKVSVMIQILKQCWGIIYLEYKYQGKLPNINTYHSSVKYSLPFSGEWVTVNGGVTEKTSHSWEIPSQRYAYDFVKLDEDGRSFCGKETEVESFYSYGEDILACADGIVTEARDQSPDSKVTERRDVSCEAGDIRGNHVLICHEEQVYSLYAHLKPGSIQVTVGQTVKRGEKIGECGNSGNTTEPHLHFQLQAGKSFYTAPGLPVEFENILVRETPSYEKFDDRNLRGEKTEYPPYIAVGDRVRNKK